MCHRLNQYKQIILFTNQANQHDYTSLQINKKRKHIADAWNVRINSLRPRQNGCLFADDTFKHIFLNENIRISTKNSMKFVPKGLINNIPALVLIMAWRRPGDKSLSEPMLVRSLTHICVTRPQWVNRNLSAICMGWSYFPHHWSF